MKVGSVVERPDPKVLSPPRTSFLYCVPHFFFSAGRLRQRQHPK